MLGEIGLPNQKSRSVFDYLSEKDRARLQHLTGRDTSDSSLPPTNSTPATIVIPTVDPVIAQAALRGFQPFTNNEEKQSRYTTYLRSQLTPSTSTDGVAPPERKPEQSLEDYNHELEEYAKSAMIFKPMSGAMANRFTSAAIIETGPKIQEGLSMPTPSSDLTDTANSATKLPDTLEVEETPKQHAARLGMYGPLTREIRDWAPARLLCKRFGVKNPRPDPVTSDPGTDMVLSTQTHSSGDSLAVAVTQLAPDVGPTRSGPKDISNVGLGEDDDQGRDTLTYQRPAMDIFKAIFASDAEDSDDDEEANAPITVAPATSVAPIPSNAPSVTPESLAPNIKNQQPVDLASFKPRFVPKSHREREGKSSHGDNAAQKSSSGKHRKPENKLKQSLVSFGADDAESMNIVVVSDTKKSKKKKGKEKEKKRVREDEAEGKELKRARSAMTITKSTLSENEADEWVEKSPPPAQRPPTPEPAGGQPRDSHHPIRPKASDFL